MWKEKQANGQKHLQKGRYQKGQIEIQIDRQVEKQIDI